MTTKRAANCRWAVPTMFMADPIWQEAEERPWTCERDNALRPLEDTEICEDCPRWEPRIEKDQHEKARTPR